MFFAWVLNVWLLEKPPVAPKPGRPVGRYCSRLFEAEAREQPIVVAEVVIDPEVALVVVQRLDRVRKVIAGEPIGVGGNRQQVEERLADRTDAVGGDRVAREWIADRLAGHRVDARGSRVVDDRRGRTRKRLGEVALVHQRRRHREQRRQPLVDVVALEAAEEERLVALDRAAQRATVRVLIPRALRGPVEEVPGIERVVAEELVQRCRETCSRPTCCSPEPSCRRGCRTAPGSCGSGP